MGKAQFWALEISQLSKKDKNACPQGAFLLTRGSKP